MTLLPPNATTYERAIESAAAGELAEVPTPLRDLWNPATCPLGLLPFLAWGVSVDFWDANWTEAEKRAAVASAIADQRCKGTRASLRQVLDRFDPLIGLVEWFEDKANLAAHTFRLELPAPSVSAVTYDEALVEALLRDIAKVKPLRSHMLAVHRLRAQAQIGLIGAATVALHGRVAGIADKTAAADPVWSTYLQTEDGEPLQDESGNFLEAA
ncbi:phage tail protein I [Erythrobacter sp. EC-HK427]|uniref:phage tail protein I n=1 Tax=Erythrobacter sp. EC-HK427 TaxID=2038396 RepID=UPI0012597F99|nr:phage tail protein I [Erythrobacter sp. EC-HK427]VVT07398.1 Phage tail protein I [Erythrobacter sp. EC-HK427]